MSISGEVSLVVLVLKTDLRGESEMKLLKEFLLINRRIVSVMLPAMTRTKSWLKKSLVCLYAN